MDPSVKGVIMKNNELEKRLKALEDYVESMFNIHESQLCWPENQIEERMKKQWKKYKKDKRFLSSRRTAKRMTT
jgi:hypothetical protein